MVGRRRVRFPSGLTRRRAALALFTVPPPTQTASLSLEVGVLAGVHGAVAAAAAVRPLLQRGQHHLPQVVATAAVQAAHPATVQLEARGELVGPATLGGRGCPAITPVLAVVCTRGGGGGGGGGGGPRGGGGRAWGVRRVGAPHNCTQTRTHRCSSGHRCSRIRGRARICTYQCCKEHLSQPGGWGACVWGGGGGGGAKVDALGAGGAWGGAWCSSSKRCSRAAWVCRCPHARATHVWVESQLKPLSSRVCHHEGPASR